ncbi:hypothetical protein [Pelagibacterium sp.]|uniref:hypothetical protein n=1 Tax=Pelagibacterium sp. TaxID=1967288 RepID=UPI003A8CD50C
MTITTDNSQTLVNALEEIKRLEGEVQLEMERHRKTWRQLEQVTGLLRDTASVAITMLYDSHKADVLAEFKVPELEAVVDASKHLQSHRVEHVYRRAWDAALSQQAEPAPINQCDGCQAGIPADEKGYHRMGKPGGYADLMYCERKRYVSEPAPAQDALLPDEIHQMAFEEGQPAEDGDGYLFTAEEFDLFVERLLSRATRPAQTEQQPAAYLRASDLERLSPDHVAGCAASLSKEPGDGRVAIYAAPIAQTAPRCQCCGYLVTDSEHRGCLRAASPAKRGDA